MHFVTLPLRKRRNATGRCPWQEVLMRFLAQVLLHIPGSKK